MSYFFEYLANGSKFYPWGPFIFAFKLHDVTVILQLVCTNILCRIFAISAADSRFFAKTCAFANYHYFIDCNSHYLSSIAMVSKHCCDNLKAVLEAFVASFKKRRSEASSLPTSDPCKINDNTLSTMNTSNTEDDFQTWFWNKSANETDSDSKKESNDEDDKNLKEEHPKTEKEASPEVLKQELKWNKEEESSLCGGYGVGSRLSRKREGKLAWELEKEGSKSYNIRTLWQQSWELRMLSATNSHDRLGQLSKSLPIDFEFPTSSLSDVPRGDQESFFSKHKIFKYQ